MITWWVLTDRNQDIVIQLIHIHLAFHPYWMGNISHTGRINHSKETRNETRIQREQNKEYEQWHTHTHLQPETYLEIKIKMTFYFLFHSEFVVIVSTFWCFSLLMLCHLCLEHDLCYWSIASFTKNKLLYFECAMTVDCCFVNCFCRIFFLHFLFCIFFFPKLYFLSFGLLFYSFIYCVVRS